MLIKHSTIALVMAGFILILLSCENDTDQPPRSFTWTYDNISYTARLDTAYLNIAFGPLILASAGTSLYAPPAEVQIGVPSFAVGTYNYTIGGSHVFHFTDPLGFSYQSLSGTLSITSNNVNRISGSFSVNLNSNKTITGNFVNTPVKP